MSTKTVTRVNITIDTDLREVLDIMKNSYPTMSYSDLIRMATGGYFASNKAQFIPSKAKSTAKKPSQTGNQEIEEWIESLPEMSLTSVQEKEIQESLLSGNDGEFSNLNDFIENLKK